MSTAAACLSAVVAPVSLSAQEEDPRFRRELPEQTRRSPDDAAPADPLRTLRERAEAIPELCAAIVSRDGETLLAEAYGATTDLDRPLNVKSVSKSLLSPRTRSPYSGHDYGYGWFVARIGAERIVYARGYGGRLLYIVPSRGITAVMLSDTARTARSGGHTGVLHDLFANHVVAMLPMEANDGR